MDRAFSEFLMTASRSRIAISLALVVATAVVYLPALHHDFINYDDPDYVTENQHVSSGLTWEGVKWAFGRIHGERTYWHPLTWLSHMVDGQWFGRKPAGHHAMNILFHALNSVLVFATFVRLTGALWRSAALAGLFAFHPLQVDTVAWVAERKNLLSAFFGLLAIWAYAVHVGKVAARRRHVPVAATPTRKPAPHFSPHMPHLPFPVSRYYLLSLSCFALSLMCKPALVTLPMLLLLLDYWPLSRARPAGRSSTPDAWLRLLAEKLPFLCLAVASGAITLLAHQGLEMLQPGGARPLAWRIENALVSYARYLGKVFWPSNLAVFYPLPDTWPPWTVALSGLLFLLVSVLAWAAVRRSPGLLVGWLWFVGALLPFIGLIQVGMQAMADRFAYVPLIGLFFALIWAVAELARRWRGRRLILSGMTMLLLLFSARFSRHQLAHWRDSITVFEHALAVTSGNYLAHQNLGEALAKQGRTADARLHFRAAIQLQPRIPESHYALGEIFRQENQTGEAIARYREALRLRPRWVGVLNNLAWLLATHPSAEFRNGAEAVALAERACQLTSHTNAALLATLAAAYAEAGRFPEAISTQHRVCELTAAQGAASALETFRQRLNLYRSGHAYRQP